MVNQNYFIDLLYISHKKLKSINIFWLGFSIYTLSYIISTTGHVNYVICQAIQFLGLVIFLYPCISLIRFKIENKYLNAIFFLYIFWQLSVICRGFQANYTSAKKMLFDANAGILLYFVPLIALFPKNLYSLKKVIDVIFIFGIFFFIYDIIFYKYLLSRTFETQNIIEDFSSLSLPCGFVLLTYIYYSNRQKLLAGSVMLLTLLISIYKARRGLSAIFLGVLLSSYFIYLFNSSRKVFNIYLSILLIIAGIFYANSLYQINKNSLFNFIAQRGETDTRTGVEIYFYNDFKTKDWVIGRGINGQYFCPGIEEDQLTNYRSYIETGYLNIILKGGIISLVLYLLIAIPALILGFFYSKNILSKASAIWISIAIISLYPTTVDSFSFQYLLVWISIGICYSRKLRYLPDDSIKDFLKSPNRFVQY
ncbi:MAG TPA: hypothetical protein VMU83_07190 [Hanamia sp.]|nr:hypothetical protein [Hanamia sp.]